MEHRTTASSRSSCRAMAAVRIISREATNLAAISASWNCRYCSERPENHTHRRLSTAQGPESPPLRTSLRHGPRALGPTKNVPGKLQVHSTPALQLPPPQGDAPSVYPFNLQPVKHPQLHTGSSAQHTRVPWWPTPLHLMVVGCGLEKQDPRT